MAAPDQNKAYQVSGRLAYGCTDLSTDWPHGGTGLGMVGKLFVSPQRSWVALAAEETSSAAEVLWLGGDVVVGFTCHNWDNDALAKVFPNTTTSSGDTLIQWPGSTVVPGAPLTPLSNLVFTPRNEAEHPGLLIYKAVILPDVNAELFLSAYRYLEIPAVVVATPDASDRLGVMGRFSRLSVS